MQVFPIIGWLSSPKIKHNAVQIRWLHITLKLAYCHIIHGKCLVLGM